MKALFISTLLVFSFGYAQADFGTSYRNAKVKKQKLELADKQCYVRQINADSETRIQILTKSADAESSNDESQLGDFNPVDALEVLNHLASKGCDVDYSGFSGIMIDAHGHIHEQ